MALGKRYAVLLALTTAAARKRGDNCPSSKAYIYAWAKVTATFETAACADVQSEMRARVDGEGWADPHNGGNYTLEAASATALTASRTTGDGKYTDEMAFAFEDSANGGCVVSGCSASQVTSVADFSTNYCNLHDLYCGSQDGCPIVSSDFTYSEKITTSSGASSDKTACLGSSRFKRSSPAIATK
mmetsp:Transcript_10861/g.33493  ORF Transcript_10861/g.33493 Transcript_10861/m.33493 type:complete len:186 (-) Transcript_10861:86-643(-)